MRILVIGTGQLAQYRINKLHDDPRVEWIGVASATRQRGADIAVTTGAHGGGSLDDMLATSVNGVIVASVTSQHVEHIRRVLPLGVPILCEKPIAPSIKESMRVATTASDAGVAIQIGFQRRFDPGLRETHRLIKRGDVGTLYSVRLTSHDHRPPPERYIPTRGSVFRDLHVHDFDLARWITGAEIEWIFARGEFRTEYRYLAEYGDPDTIVMLLRTTDGVLVSISGAQHDAVGHDVRAEIFGSRDSIAVGFDDTLALNRLPRDPSIRRQPRHDTFLDRFSDAFAAETKAFIDFICGDLPNPCPAESAIAALRIAAAAELSTARGVPVSVVGNSELNAM